VAVHLQRQRLGCARRRAPGAWRGLNGQRRRRCGVRSCELL
jgi:hypothetical protein